MKPKRKPANKDKIKIPKSKHAIIQGVVVTDWLFSGKPLKREGFPDILGFSLERAVKAVREEPKLLYDENYILNLKPELVCQGESFIKVIIERLQNVFIETLQNPNTTETEKIKRIVEAREWIKKLFDAAKFGIIDQVDFPGGHPPKNIKDIEVIKKEYGILYEKLIHFMKKNFASYIQEKRRFHRLKFPEGKVIDQVMIKFWEENKNYIPIEAIRSFSQEPEYRTNTISKTVKLILAKKYGYKLSYIKNLIN